MSADRRKWSEAAGALERLAQRDDDPPEVSALLGACAVYAEMMGAGRGRPDAARRAAAHYIEDVMDPDAEAAR